MSNIFSLEKKTIVAFGGAGYLGSATVAAFLELGAKVVVADWFPDYAKEHASQFEGNPNCELIHCDVKESADIRAAFDRCIENFGSMNTVVNLVAYGPKNGAIPMHELTDEQFRIGVEGSLDVMFRVMREAIPYLLNVPGANIVNTCSMYGLVSPDYRIYGTSGQNNPSYYGAGKAGVAQLTRYAAGHYGRQGIRVNCVTPGPFPAPRNLPPEDFMAELAGKTMLGRVGAASDIAGAFCYLVSDAAAFTTGSNVVVDGGWTAW